MGLRVSRLLQPAVPPQPSRREGMTATRGANSGMASRPGERETGRASPAAGAAAAEKIPWRGGVIGCGRPRRGA